MVRTETRVETRDQSRLAKVGWGILLVISALLVFQGITWVFQGPEFALDNISERTSLGPDGFRQGDPSAFDVITLISRNFAIGQAALGLLGLLLIWQGYRHGSRWAWRAMGVPVAAVAATAANFILVGGLSGVGLGYLGLAAITLVAYLLAGRGQAR